MNINELNNEEVLFLYFSNRKWVETYEDIFEHKNIEDVLDILDFGQVRVTRYLQDEDIDEMVTRDHYKYCMSINQKLGPIADIIEEADSVLYNQVKDCFEKAEV
jgi:hypothetical protein